jgi:2-aminobenzoate-CoA ligase
LENASPANMINIIETYKATIAITTPTAYRAMMIAMDEGANLSSLRLAVSAGETLPAPVFEAWTRKTGKPILNGIGATEMLHIFISNRLGEATAGATGRPVSGYEARIVDDDMQEVPDGQVGHLAVRGPTGCRYLADERQTTYVRAGWNLTGDDFSRDSNGVFQFVARADDMIISSGYNIAGPEVGSGALDACGRGRVRGDRRTGSRAWPDRGGACGVAARRRRRCRLRHPPAGPRQGDHCAL